MLCYLFGLLDPFAVATGIRGRATWSRSFCDETVLSPLFWFPMERVKSAVIWRLSDVVMSLSIQRTVKFTGSFVGQSRHVAATIGPFRQAKIASCEG